MSCKYSEKVMCKSRECNGCACDDAVDGYREKVEERLKKATVIGADCVGKRFECVPTWKAVQIVRKAMQ